MWARAVAVVGAVLLLGAVAATFLPTSPAGATCGTWVSPEWPDDQVEAMLEKADQTIQDAESLDGGFGEQAYGIRAEIVAVKSVCDDALGTRRTVSLVLLGAAVVVPAGVWFVAGGARRRTTPVPD